MAVEFAKRYQVIGFDLNKDRINELRNGLDSTLEISSEQLEVSSAINFTTDPKDLVNASIYIVTVPTPINKHSQPDLAPLINASKTIGKFLEKDDLVIYESTVYPGATEEDCVPVLEQYSGLIYNKDFYVGYSPERINPGDKDHKVTDILKVTSGSNQKTAEQVDDLYNSIILAGTFKASSIKVAEAAKVIENTQRDVNIGLINELAVIFNKLDIDTEEVLKAAGTKWNFLPFRPGLVGGHCIGVDPFYLTHKAQSVGYHPEIILAGRRLNDGMGSYIASQLVKAMLKSRIQVHGSNVLVMGLSFKENCPDIRNTKVIDIIKDLKEYGVFIDCYDPWVDLNQAKKEYNLELIHDVKSNFYDAIILAVSHKDFIDMGAKKIKSYGKQNCIIYDLKYILDAENSDMRL